MLESAPATEPEDRARAARMLTAIDGLEHGSADTRAAEEAIAALPPDLARYHRLSLAWSMAWVDIAQGRPWRAAFARASASVRPGDVPVRYLVWQALQELLATVVTAIGLLMLVLLGWE